MLEFRRRGGEEKGLLNNLCLNNSSKSYIMFTLQIIPRWSLQYIAFLTEMRKLNASVRLVIMPCAFNIEIGFGVEDNFLAELFNWFHPWSFQSVQFHTSLSSVLQLQNEACKNCPGVAVYILTFYICINLISSLTTKQLCEHQKHTGV